MAADSAEGTWLDFVADLMSGPLTELPDERISAQLGLTFDLTGVAYDVRSAGTRPAVRLWPRDEQFGGHRADIGRWGADLAPTRHPLLRFYLATGSPVALQVSDVPDRFAGSRVQAAWREVGRSWGVPAQLSFPVQLSHTGGRTFVMGRQDAFRPGEIRLARRLQRLLSGLDRQVRALRLVPGAPADVRERAEAVRLTPRELTVLALVAEGLTAAAVARRLLLSERTVRKHLERVHTKLGVRDRVSAVLRAQRLGLLRSPGLLVD